MRDVTNADRAGWAPTALDAFGAETGQTCYDYSNPEHFLEIAGDLVCNLFHLAAEAGITAVELIGTARGHYDEEVCEEEEQEVGDEEPEAR